MKCSTCDKDAVYGWSSGGGACKECVTLQANPLPAIVELKARIATLEAELLAARDLLDSERQRVSSIKSELATLGITLRVLPF